VSKASERRKIRLFTAFERETPQDSFNDSKHVKSTLMKKRIRKVEKNTRKIKVRVSVTCTPLTARITHESVSRPGAARKGSGGASVIAVTV